MVLIAPGVSRKKKNLSFGFVQTIDSVAGLVGFEPTIVRVKV